jgi:hypothetical protein
MHPNAHKITVLKLNTDREETWRYEGHILSRTHNSILIEALFNRPDLPFHGITMRENDRFIERYFADRWYNIFEIHDREDGVLKAWYCNVTMPAEISPETIRYVDLALDVLVYPNGAYLVLDQDEFIDLDIDTHVREKAQDALESLIRLAENDLLGKTLKEAAH